MAMTYNGHGGGGLMSVYFGKGCYPNCPDTPLQPDPVSAAIVLVFALFCVVYMIMWLRKRP